jgi:hypothetical protein
VRNDGTRNHKEPCLESKVPGEPGEVHAWPRNLGSDTKNEWGRCNDANASCVTPTGPVSCAELPHEDDREPLDNTVC